MPNDIIHHVLDYGYTEIGIGRPWQVCTSDKHHELGVPHEPLKTGNLRSNQLYKRGGRNL